MDVIIEFVLAMFGLILLGFVTMLGLYLRNRKNSPKVVPEDYEGLTKDKLERMVQGRRGKLVKFQNDTDLK